MVYQFMVFASRKAGITHEYFKQRYERHMKMIEGLCKGAEPSSHTRFYPIHDSNTGKPVLMAGNADDIDYSTIVLMEFPDEAAFQRFYQALLTEEANEKIIADEAGFWERNGMKAFAVESCKTWGS
ncbi:uncharacterized protein MYCFIDRAFT_212616 [Pseudocercospora fijiensis CIRAD86]|uniref:EthD domain-containing protein n=1 Tax=Pseudocercospora fijiensis (strain CIRAD86) TaxID=383855 RepID=M3ALI2_PSEFD|nr:uncharacterized protein MYCFIDRAFT_212616 [Pseudocercospora fijiensis CIRAD86]EME78018.1 hypothetical protein MYCFIDRAFT_212616 [Pseudocercospora fijiensis CIRAD86]